MLGPSSPLGTLDYPTFNLQAFLEYSENDDSLVSINPLAHPNFDPGGEETGVLDRWKDSKIEIKKYIDDVSGSEKLHCGLEYSSKVIDNSDEIRYIHSSQGQALFNHVRLGAADKGMKLN